MLINIVTKMVSTNRRVVHYTVLSIIGLTIVVPYNNPVVYAQDMPHSESTLQQYNVYLLGGETSNCSPAGQSGSSVNISVDRDFSLGTEPQERRTNLMRALIADFGLTPEQAAGPVGNFMEESGGHHLPPDVNEGQTSGAPPRFSGGYGWAQWTGSRQRMFINFAIEHGYMSSENDRATDAANYAYFKHELTEGGDVQARETISELQRQATPEDAAISFHDTFERAGIQRIPDRERSARQAFGEFTGGGLPSGGSPSGCPGGTSGATVVGDTAFPLLIPNKGGVGNPAIFSGNTTTGGHNYTAFDIYAAIGTPVGAFMSGTVTRLGTDRCPGRYVSIYNEESDLTITYMHLHLITRVNEGDTVRPGDLIGAVGIGVADEGCRTPHLHIDAVTGRDRPSCSRRSCSSENMARFVDIGPQLFETFQALPD